MDPVSEVKKSFDDTNIKIRDINLVRYDERIFGNFVVDVYIDNNILRIIKDRGQFFVNLERGSQHLEEMLRKIAPTDRLDDVLNILKEKI